MSLQIIIHLALAAGFRSMSLDALAPQPISTYSANVSDHPATQPSLSQIDIISKLLPWKIIVKPISSPARPPSLQQTVTVGDVLTTIYRSLHIHITRHEFESLSSPSREHVVDAYHNRVQQILDVHKRDTERAKGVKRVDFLTETSNFIGLSMTTDPEVLEGRGLGHVWEMNVERPSEQLTEQMDTYQMQLRQTNYYST